MKTIELKTWPEYWDAIYRGEKTFELRFNDRDYQVGDILHLRRWDNEKECYTEHAPIAVLVTYVATKNGVFAALSDGWVCLGIKIISGDLKGMPAYPPRYVVLLERGVWLAPWEGDPGRTTQKENAMRYATSREALDALTRAREFRPFHSGGTCRE